ncbi:lasso peptide biosynthesis B2 protein [Myxosarcina sp. GI1]|uniref:lasso peptide biosynthesis B2 protein n=1 Tax=Myxosarcina sp. GI1 TaxID=1541065 RepID=UPI00055E077C|nr:lasso peptide biosynthesis B2 protein [Myxosarcina sp. GI1]
MKQVLNFIDLTGKERRLLIDTFVLLGLIRLGLWLLPYGTLSYLLDKVRQQFFNYQKVSHIELDKILWAIDLCSRYWFREVKCLAKALTTQTLMSSYGYCSQLQIGVAKNRSGNLEAHAWIENEGKIVIGYLPDLSRFTPLTTWSEKES